MCSSDLCVSVALRLSQPGQSEAAGVLRIGNAAQTLHPVAGQGFNLGLRDAWELAEAISHCGDIANLGGAAFCQRYLAARRNDRRLIVGLTDSLARGFLAQAAPLPALRGLGLAALNGLRPLRYSITKDGLLFVGSETGMVVLHEPTIAKKGRVGPGQMIGVDLVRGQFFDEDRKSTRLNSSH